MMGSLVVSFMDYFRISAMVSAPTDSIPLIDADDHSSTPDDWSLISVDGGGETTNINRFLAITAEWFGVNKKKTNTLWCSECERRLPAESFTPVNRAKTTRTERVCFRHH